MACRAADTCAPREQQLPHLSAACCACSRIGNTEPPLPHMLQSQVPASPIDLQRRLHILEQHLADRVFLAGDHITLADPVVYVRLREAVQQVRRQHCVPAAKVVRDSGCPGR